MLHYNNILTWHAELRRDLALPLDKTALFHHFGGIDRPNNEYVFSSSTTGTELN